MEKEIRNYEIDFRYSPETRTIEGRAIPFNVASPNREGFREIIAPEAVEGVIERSDIKFYYNHDNTQGFLARNNKGKGSLKIDVREDGVYFSFEAGKDNLSEYVYERLQRGELNEMSWAFTAKEQTWTRNDEGVAVRTITKFDRLYDFSVVDTSYYGIENVVSCRSFEEFKEEEARKAAEEAERLAQEQRDAEEKAKEEIAEQLAAYYSNLRQENDKYLKK